MNIDLNKLKNDENKSSILVFGDFMIDKYIWGSCNRISPEAPVPIVTEERITYSPGGAGNVYRQIEALNGNGTIMGAISEDDEDIIYGNIFPESRHESIKLLKIADVTTTKTRIMVQNRQIARIDKESRRDEEGHSIFARYNNQELLLKELDNYFKTVDIGAIVIADYVKGICAEPCVSYMMAESKARKIPIIIDTKSMYIHKYFGATVITPNDREWDMLSSKYIDISTHIEHIMVTMGRHGIRWLDNKNRKIIDISSCARHVFDVTGAGDVFVGTLATMLACGYDMHESAYIANVAAGISVESIGTSVVTIEEILNKMNRS